MFDTDSGSSSSTNSDVSKKELEEFLLIAKQKAKFDAQLRSFNDVCWDICYDKPGSKLDHKTETCLSNCVDRFIDASLFVTNRFIQNVNKNQQKFRFYIIQKYNDGMSKLITSISELTSIFQKFRTGS